jgi:cytochrome c2
MNTDYTKKIDSYLRGYMNEDGRLQFEQELLTNNALREEFELQRDLEESIKRNYLRSVVENIAKRYHLMKKLYFSGILLLSISVIFLLGIFVWNKLNNQPTLDESRFEELSISLSEKPLIDNLEDEFFIWKGLDTVVLSKSGVLLSVPENSFLLNGKLYRGQAIVQWQEALDGATIMKSGLSTVADGNLLETQGMFSFRAHTPEGQLLDINPETGIYVQIPVEEHKEGMRLYDGVKNEDGIINWVNPEPLMKIPVPVDMSNLDFYPVGYEDSLNSMRLRKDKRFRDSLYLAMETGFVPNYDLGKKLFESKCATCHKIGENSTGPDLRGVRNKWMRAGEPKEMLYTFVRDWSLACEQSVYAKKIASWSPTAPTKFTELTDCEIESVFKYVDDSSYDLAIESDCGHFEFIYPSKVLAFWNKKFNNTLLATREFERRMSSVHATCRNEVLDVYVKNLHLPLTELDKKVKEMGYPEFAQFEAEYVGALNPNNPHLKNLQKFYAVNTQQLRSQAQFLKDQEQRKREKWDKEMNDGRIKEQNRTATRKSQALQEEYKLNYDNVIKQFGGTIGTVIYGNSPIKNIDRQVMEATMARETTEIIDPATGKTTTITYNDFGFEVDNHIAYDKLYAYLFPSKFNSYERITGNQGKFDYPLNDDVLYDVAVIGVNENGFYYFQQTKLNSGDLGKVTLTKVSEEKLDASINQLNKLRLKKPMPIKDELNWLFKEQADYVEKKNRMKQARFEEKIKKIIFPCYYSLSESEAIINSIEYVDF